VGAAAPLLGWSGEVDGDDFTNLLAGADLRKPRVTGVAGFDLTCRAPKSVSVLWAVAPADVAGELRARHEAAVAEALGYLEREACHGRRGTDGVVQVPGAGFVGAAFVHRSSCARAILCCTRTSWSATSPKARTVAGPRWMAGICTDTRRRPVVCIRRCCGAS
jgi:conjugative relaxase-like TrwC/TraI family protein